MSKKLVLAVLLTLIYMLIVVIINTNFPNNNLKLILIGISAMAFLLVSKKLNEKWFTTKA